MTKKAAKPLNIEFSSDVPPALAKDRIEPPAVEVETRRSEHTGGGETFSEDLIILNVRNCSACGGNHDGVAELPLPSPAAADVRHTHYYHCPTTGQTVTIEHKE